MSGFTGKRNDVYWYRGHHWLGPSNEIGNRRGRARQRYAETKRAPNPKDSQLPGTLRACNDGPFTLLAATGDTPAGLVSR
jgi:hypothetical protein